MNRKIIITEKQLSFIRESIYDPEKMYSKEYINLLTKKAPKYIKKIINELPEYEHSSKPGIFIKIPQVIFQYIKGNF